MTALKYIMTGLLCLGGGAVSAAGIFAIITSVGLINRYAKVTNTASHIRLYEDMIVLGAALGNIWLLYEIPVPVGIAGAAVFGLMSGIYVGSFAVCLAETVKAIPVLVRRTRIAGGLGWIVLCIALGKGIGSLVYYLRLYVTN